MRGTAIDERLEDAAEDTAETGTDLVRVLLEVTADGVVTEWERGRLAVAVMAFGEACAAERPIVQEIAGTLRVTRTALKAGMGSTWTQRRRAEHVRDMTRTTNETARVS